MSKNKKAKKTQKKSAKPKAKVKKVKKVSKKAVKKAVKKAAPAKAAKALKKPSKVLSSQALAATKASAKEALKGKVLPLAHPIAAPEVQEEVVLTNAEGKRYCKVTDCDEVEAIDAYCRLHYIMYWKRNKTKGKILEGGKLDKYIDELTARYPDKYLEMLKKDLSSEKEFNSIISEMDAEEAADEDSEEEDNRFIEEVRGTVPTSTGDDDGEF